MTTEFAAAQEARLAPAVADPHATGANVPWEVDTNRSDLQPIVPTPLQEDAEKRYRRIQALRLTVENPLPGETTEGAIARATAYIDWIES